MKITYRQSGGYAGLTKQCELDTETMAPPDREALQALVEQAGPPESMTALSERARDVMEHDLRIERGGETSHLVVDDLSAPASLRPLLGYLQKRAKSAPGR